jgi:hypothetical protein
VSLTYQVERQRRNAIDVDQSQALFTACETCAPSPEAVLIALRAGGLSLID